MTTILKYAGRNSLIVGIGLISVCLLVGCGLQNSSPVGGSVSGTSARSLSGTVHGGQQPVSGGVIQLYAATTSGYGAAASPLIASVVKTDANGEFTITNDYTCPPGALVYIAATGGNPGLSNGTNNSAIALVAALGPCSALSSSTYIQINELTTVAAAWALQQFSSGYASLGTSATNFAGLTSAFAAANNLVNTSNGQPPGASLPTGATIPTAEINTLADILASCVNSSGGTSGDHSNCGTLFSAATPTGGTAPTDTFAAALDIAQNPTSSPTTLLGLAVADSPFQPMLSSAPNNWTIAVSYSGGGLNSPSALAMDNSGNAWIANSGNNTITELNNLGTALSPPTGFTGGGLNSPDGLAVDSSGYVWVANSGGNSVSKFTSVGSPFVSTAYTGGGLNAPKGISIDGFGNVWVANHGNNSVTELNSAGTALSTSIGDAGGGVSQPSAIAINPK